MSRIALNSAAVTFRPVGYAPDITRAVTFKPATVVVRRMSPTSTATLASTTPAHVAVIWLNSLCSTGFHLDAPGG